MSNPDLSKQLSTPEGRMVHLLLQCGELAKCKGCGAEIFWMRHLNGKKVPYTAQGLNHFADCPDAARFRKPKSTAP